MFVMMGMLGLIISGSICLFGIVYVVFLMWEFVFDWWFVLLVVKYL